MSDTVAILEVRRWFGDEKSWYTRAFSSVHTARAAMREAFQNTCDDYIDAYGDEEMAGLTKHQNAHGWQLNRSTGALAEATLNVYSIEE